MGEKDQIRAEAMEDPADPFYHPNNIRELKRQLDNIKNGTDIPETHDFAGDNTSRRHDE